MRFHPLPVVALLACTTPALADSIDGKWCSEDGRRIDISGSSGIWGKGVSLKGDYFRYTFLFEMPAGEPDAGQKVEMRLRRADQKMLVRIGDGDTKVWQKCQAEIS